MPKTLPTLDEFLAALPADRRDTMTTLHQAIRKAVPKLAPAIMSGMGGSPIIGYGKYHYKSASGREGDWFLIGLAAGKSLRVPRDEISYSATRAGGPGGLVRPVRQKNHHGPRRPPRGPRAVPNRAWPREAGATPSS